MATYVTTGNGRNKREAATLLARRAEVLRHWRSGMSYSEIAKVMGMRSKQLVGVDVRLALREWREEHRASISASVELELDYLNNVTVELLSVYEAAKLTKDRDRLADAKTLVDSIAKLSQERRKLLGLDKPVKIEAQTTSEVSLSTNFKPLDQLKAEVRMKQAALSARKADSGK